MSQGTIPRQQPISPQHLRRLRTLYESVARDFGVGLSALLRTSVDVRLAGVDQCRYGQFVSELQPPACFYVLKADPLDDRAMLDIEPAILHQMIDRLLGGPGEDGPPPGRPLTEIEWCLSVRIVRLFLQNCRDTCSGVLDLKLDVLQQEDNPRLLRVLPADEMVILVRFELAIGQLRGTMRLCWPGRVIEQLGDKPRPANPALASRPLPGSLAEVQVTLAETQIAAGDLADFRVGDIIATETAVDSPATVSIEGVAKFRARPGVYQGRKAVRLTEPIDAPAPLSDRERTKQRGARPA